MNTLPTQPGFYWWREGTLPFRMIQVMDLSGLLAAYDVEKCEFKWRYLKDWQEYAEVGEWIAVPVPPVNQINLNQIK